MKLGFARVCYEDRGDRDLRKFMSKVLYFRVR